MAQRDFKPLHCLDKLVSTDHAIAVCIKLLERAVHKSRKLVDAETSQPMEATFQLIKFGDEFLQRNFTVPILVTMLEEALGILFGSSDYQILVDVHHQTLEVLSVNLAFHENSCELLHADAVKHVEAPPKLAHSHPELAWADRPIPVLVEVREKLFTNVPCDVQVQVPVEAGKEIHEVMVAKRSLLVETHGFQQGVEGLVH
mmetsp:Transcript_141590/g.394675  ORF Transcript_141590/g.394675 Transcript_141590/m.394675 type:complete len:201 (+) Transcript_141590:1051-1653(+)